MSSVAFEANEGRHCDLCATAHESDERYFVHAFHDAKQLSLTSEAMADTLGFCERHGAKLMAAIAPTSQLARVLAGTVPHLMPLLDEDRFGDPRFQQVYFSRPDACPACAFAHRAVGRDAARISRELINASECLTRKRLSGICTRHFPLVSRSMSAERRMQAITHYGQRLECVARAVDLRAETHERSIRPSDDSDPLLLAALQLAGGNARPDAEPSLNCAIPAEDDGACPVCQAMGATRLRWLNALSEAARHGIDASFLFPTCAQHVRCVADQSDHLLSALVAAHALRVVIDELRLELQGLIKAAQAREERAAATIVNWGRRRRRRKKLDDGAVPSVTPPTHAPRCAACERLAVCELGMINALLKHLGNANERGALDGGPRLCLKHHAHAYLLSPRGKVRAALAEAERCQLDSVLDTARAYETDATSTTETTALQNDLALHAGHFFCLS